MGQEFEIRPEFWARAGQASPAINTTSKSIPSGSQPRSIFFIRPHAFRSMLGSLHALQGKFFSQIGKSQRVICGEMTGGGSEVELSLARTRSYDLAIQMI